MQDHHRGNPHDETYQQAKDDLPSLESLSLGLSSVVSFMR
jgi:hypothetical protein